MSGALHFAALTLRLNFRQPMAMVYGYLFPLVFLAAFAVIYRHDGAPVIGHLGELLTVTALGGACFGLPTAIVAERERGVWRRYRASPAPAATFVSGLIVARLVLLCSAAAMQIALAMALLGMPPPRDPVGLALAFLAASAALIGLGMIVAMLAGSVPAVQALGQCIFLPMLMIGGVAVRLSSLPDWAQRLSAFFPGRYCVVALQRSATGAGPGVDELVALGGFALAGAAVAAGLFRWDRRQRPGDRRLVLAGVALWLAVGLLGLRMGEAGPEPMIDDAPVGPPQAYLRTPPAAETPPPAASDLDDREPPQPPVAPSAAEPAAGPVSWRDVRDADIANIAFERLPDDAGLVSPIAPRGTLEDEAVREQIAAVRAGLPGWAPSQVPDPVQKVRNMLAIAAVPDVLQMDPLERHLPWLVYDQLRQEVPQDELRAVLFWISQHPFDGRDEAVRQLAPLGLPQVSGPTRAVRERVMIYALKFLQRLEAQRTEARIPDGAQRATGGQECDLGRNDGSGERC